MTNLYDASPAERAVNAFNPQGLGPSREVLEGLYNSGLVQDGISLKEFVGNAPTKAQKIALNAPFEAAYNDFVNSTNSTVLPTQLVTGRQGASSQEQGFRVKLVSVLDTIKGAPGQGRTQVIFKVTPTFSEARTVDYSAVQPIHMPGGIQVYKFTNSRTFDLTAHFISRNAADALENIRYLQILRSWTTPFFGKSSTNFSSKSTSAASGLPGDLVSKAQSGANAAMDKIKNGGDSTKGVNLLGAPPEVLYLYGYSSRVNDSREGIKGINVNRIPVVITSLNISYPEDVDYIPIEVKPTNKTEPFPVKMDVSINLVETHSPVEYEKFSLEAFKSGTLNNF